MHAPTERSVGAVFALFRFGAGGVVLIFLRGEPELLFEIAVEASQGGVAAFQGAVEAGVVGVGQKVRRMVQPPRVQILIVPDAHFLFEKAGYIFGVVAHLRGKGDQGAFALEMLFHVG